MLGKPSDPLLAKTENALLAKVAPAMKASMDKIIHAGLTIMYSPALAKQRMQALAKATNPPEDAAQGAIRLMAELYKQSKGTLPKPLIIPGAMIFAFEYLDLAAKVGKAKITPQLIADTTQATGDALLQSMGISQQKLQQMIAAKGQPGSAPPQGGLINAPAGA